MRALLLPCLALSVTACGAEEPRSIDYFAAHEAEAKTVLADCEADKMRGQECDNARQGAMLAAANRALTYTPSTQKNKRH